MGLSVRARGFEVNPIDRLYFAIELKLRLRTALVVSCELSYCARARESRRRTYSTGRLTNVEFFRTTILILMRGVYKIKTFHGMQQFLSIKLKPKTRCLEAID